MNRRAKFHQVPAAPAPDWRAAAGSLAAWYRTRAGAYPFRADAEPYRVWLAESMLQQTRMEAALPKWKLFLELFPDVEALAAADEGAVLAAWAGLGYYRRARSLHAAAREIAARGWPRTAREWELLPGVGPYTAAAVSSIAFGSDARVYDGNVRRVAARLARRPDPDRREAEAILDPLYQAAAAAAGAEAFPVGDVNQALMDLGRAICVPRGPDCAACPLSAACGGRAAGDARDYPSKLTQQRTLDVELTFVALLAPAAGGAAVLTKRHSGEAFLRGQSFVPYVARPARGGSLPPRYGYLPPAPWDAARLPVLADIGGKPIRHAITRHAIVARVVGACLEGAFDPAPGYAWVGLDELGTAMISSLAAKIAPSLRACARGERGLFEGEPAARRSALDFFA